jgi:hypothetical protein
VGIATFCSWADKAGVTGGKVGDVLTCVDVGEGGTGIVAVVVVVCDAFVDASEGFEVVNRATDEDGLACAGGGNKCDPNCEAGDNIESG